MIVIKISHVGLRTDRKLTTLGVLSIHLFNELSNGFLASPCPPLVVHA